MANLPQKKTVTMVISGLIVAVLPSLIGYFENRNQIQEKTAQTQTQASSGYDALAASVKELQAATLAQHDYIVKMQAQLELMQDFIVARTSRTETVRPRAGQPRPVAVREPEPIHLPAPPAMPAYGKVPDDINAAVQQIKE